VKKKKIKPSEIVEAAIERIERHNPSLTFVVFTAYEEARQKAAKRLSGQFAGVPMLLKEIFGAKKIGLRAVAPAFLPAVDLPLDAILVARSAAADR
jgi:Asp-tRNA(Asn)/Glu-tRNA(Gln) amidotransferase A subunit family amidase